MKTIQVPLTAEVSPVSQALFDQIKKKVGKLPNLYATIGYSASALKGFLDFEASLNSGVFTPKEREAIALIVSEINQCAYCLAAHTILATSKGFTKAETLDIRRGHTGDERLNVILRLAKSIVEDHGHADQALVDDFFAAGYPQAALVELTGLVTARIFTNYVYALTDVPVDFPTAEAL
ncbi:carboxymuconolactone decarboxylase family protein [Dawidia soli]|uniref:Carboxymuconolactone decarboxylase family protein n=1 Tax=Dawidia soli TaxID=2782352 RepID=A0AAP2GCA6_9BACT|nr:carboxymuconolactone decarboxylase family protein [Dawidia soli]MBT1685957.1 carboxymuconolactone decarboxylase family protein [Dawidia soli]